jgi:V/A-type H+-transporting ATPase subunit A
MAGRIVKVAGPLVVADGMEDARMNDVVLVSDEELVGEIIELRGARASIQVYEETAGLAPGQSVVTSGRPLSVELGPGLIGSIYDGIQRPLNVIFEKTGDFIERGVSVPALDRERRWTFESAARVGDRLGPGDLLGTVRETVLVQVRIQVPPGVEGELVSISDGDFTVTDPVAVLRTAAGETAVTMMQKWPVRESRPYRKRLSPGEPLNTGQRIIDSLFPLAKGGTACIPGPFGSGKTVVQHQLAKWADASIIIYVGCGERGNEMTDVLREFPRLKDPRSGEPLIRRTVLIANTSNMPVAAREASIYTGMTIAEYFRDMGLHVALMADSTSRWAEALREISGRQEEMPGEEGYPAYLATRVAEFYERSGRVRTLGGGEREGTLSVIGAVSPPGGDLSDPVVQASLKVVKVFWGLDDKLAYRRHFPAINWLSSYSLYLDNLQGYFEENVGSGWAALRARAMTILQKEDELLEIARLVGRDSLEAPDRLLLETAKMIREDFLHQNAFHAEDQYTSLEKQHLILKGAVDLHEASAAALGRGISLKTVLSVPERRRMSGIASLAGERIGEMVRTAEEALRALENIVEEQPGAARGSTGGAADG